MVIFLYYCFLDFIAVVIYFVSDIFEQGYQTSFYYLEIVETFEHGVELFVTNDIACFDENGVLEDLL